MSSASCKSSKLMISTIPLLIILIINLSSYATAVETTSACFNNGNYTTTGSTFDRNLQTLLNTLTFNNFPDNGYYAASITDLINAETITTYALCRADLTPFQCQTCIQFAAQNLYEICRSHRQGVFWPIQHGSCMVRYFDVPTLTLSPPSFRFIQSNGLEAANTSQFKVDRDALLSALLPLAAGESGLKVRAGSRRTSSVGSSSPIIYGLVQCRPDLSSGDCGRCLEEATAALQSCCDFQTWVTVRKPDCGIEYDTGSRSFYNEARLRELGVLLPMVGARNVGLKKITSKNRAYYISKNNF